MSISPTHRHPYGRTLIQRWLLPLLMTLIIVSGDHLTKAWILQHLGPIPGLRQIPVVGDWVVLTFVQNTGVAFGMFQNMNTLLTFTALLISAGAIYAYLFYLPSSKIGVQLSIGLIIGGAMGNIVDRITLGYVVDFIKVGWWPVFNIADSAINVGVVLLGIYLLFTPEQLPDQPSTPPEDMHLLDELLGQDPPRSEARSSSTMNVSE